MASPDDSSPAFTPGPWVVQDIGPRANAYRFDVYGEGGRYVAPRLSGPDARLIASAPDLLEALRRLMNEAVLDGLEARAGWDCWIANARAAVEKAEGRPGSGPR